MNMQTLSANMIEERKKQVIIMQHQCQLMDMKIKELIGEIKKRDAIIKAQNTSMNRLLNEIDGWRNRAFKSEFKNGGENADKSKPN
jgi:hypothetical protein